MATAFFFQLRATIPKKLSMKQEVSEAIGHAHSKEFIAAGLVAWTSSGA